MERFHYFGGSDRPLNIPRVTVRVPRSGALRPMPAAHVALAQITASRSVTLSNGRGGTYTRA